MPQLKNKISNEELIFAYQNEKNEKIKKEIAEKLYKNVSRLIYKMLSILESKHIVLPFMREDLIQEAGLIFMQCIKKFDTTKKIKFSTYFSRACCYELKRYNKKQMSHLNNIYDIEIDEIIMAKPEDVESKIDDKNALSKIKSTLLKLNKEKKITDKQFNTIIEEHGFFGSMKKTRKEIANEKQCSLQNVGFLYRKAVNRIKQEIENE